MHSPTFNRGDPRQGRPVHAGDAAQAVIDRMARTINTKISENGCATEADLMDAGFTRTAIARNEDQARTHAAQLRGGDV